jgi:hypothetical protein
MKEIETEIERLRGLDADEARDAKQPDSVALTITRWVLFVPAAFASVLPVMLLYFIQSFFLKEWLVQFYMTPLGAALFVLVGAKVAPTRRVWPAACLLGWHVLMGAFGLYSAWTIGDENKAWCVILYLLSVAGAAVGFGASRVDEEE